MQFTCKTIKFVCKTLKKICIQFLNALKIRFRFKRAPIIRNLCTTILYRCDLGATPKLSFDLGEKYLNFFEKHPKK